MNSKFEQIFDRFQEGTATEWAVFVIAALAIVGAVWALIRFRSSLHGDADPAAEDVLLVRHVRELRDSGAVSEEEYRSLKKRLAPTADETSSGAPRRDRDNEPVADG